jgi:hypothetical protein
VLRVWAHDDAAAFTPAVVLAADGDASVERDDDLDRVVCMRGHHALRLSRSGTLGLASEVHNQLTISQALLSLVSATLAGS